jgi:hypothetical protein
MLGLIDESTPASARGVHYVLGAAVLLDAHRREEVRERASKLIGDRQRPFHWKDEGVEKRAGMIRLLGDVDVGVFATIHHPVAHDRQAAARRRSLTDLATTACREGVSELLIESRGSQDTEDRQTLLDAIHARECPGELQYGFASKNNALMWLPDAVAGILSEVECHRSDRWICELQRAITIFDIRRLDAHEPRLLS